VKFASLGGIVAATGVMAGLAAMYGFWTAFGPGDAAPFSRAFLPGLLSVFFGAFWGLVIFNLDRYIVASTGKGDGTETITLKEFVNALPRLFLAILIGFVISTPLEIRVFKTEIESRLQDERASLARERAAKLEQDYAQELARNADRQGALQRRIDSTKGVVEQMRVDAARELDGSGGSGIPNAGPRYREKKAMYDLAKGRADTLERVLGAEIAALARQDSTARAHLDAAKDSAATESRKLDGLSKRIQLAHEVAGSGITWALRLLLMAIEITPVLFKLMIIKGPYDYLEENVKELVKARRGIRTDWRAVPGPRGGLLEYHEFNEARTEAARREREFKAQDAVHAEVAKRWVTDETAKARDGRADGAGAATG
jgi:hypothetical protein